jgi:hypothetical protein
MAASFSIFSRSAEARVSKRSEGRSGFESDMSGGPALFGRDTERIKA